MTRALRQQCRQAERRWKKDKFYVSLDILRDSLSIYQKAVKQAKCQYLSDIISNNGHCPRVLFSTIDSVVNPQNSYLTDQSVLTCEDFLNFFNDKVMSVRQLASCNVSADMSVNVIRPVMLDHFEPISFSLLTDVFQHMRPTNCPLDIFPTRLLKEVLHIIGPSLVILMNSCLSAGCVPVVFKHAIVRPLLKKSNLDPTVLSSFRPVSNLSFNSKVVEKIVLNQLQPFLESNSILEKFQSGFRSWHSTESALLKVHNDIALSVDAVSCYLSAT